MSESVGLNAQQLTAELEQRLATAKKDKTLAQVPALRRLRVVVQVFLVLGIIGLVLTLGAGAGLRITKEAVAKLGLGYSSYLALGLYAVSLWLSLIVGLCTLCAYARFLRQFKENHVSGLENTMAIILKLWTYSIVLMVLGLMLAIATYQSAAATAGVATSGIPGMVALIAMYFVVRHYIKTAQEELPALAGAGEGVPLGNYRAWKSLVFILAPIALIVLGAGYVLSGLS